jgi:lysophospholipase L1-like esterase
VVTDARGFRIDPTQPPSRKKKNLLVIGDSVTLGTGVDAPAAYPYLLDHKLKDYHVINASVSGYWFNDYLNVLSSLIGTLNPKGIIIGICLNDFNNISQKNIMRLDEKYHRSDIGNINNPVKNENISEDHLIRYPNPIFRFLRYINDNYFNFNDFLNNYSRSYVLIKAKFADTSRDYFLADLLTYKKPGISKEIADKFKRLRTIVNGHCWLVMVILPYEYQLRVGTKDILLPQKLITEAAKEQHLTVIDLYDQVNQYIKQHKLKPKYLFLYNDPEHFSALGHKIVAELIYRELVSHHLVN